MGRNKTNIVKFIIDPDDINIQKSSPVMNIHAYFPEIVINNWRYKEGYVYYHMYMERGNLKITENNPLNIVANSGVDLYTIVDNMSSATEYEKDEKDKDLYSLIKNIILGTFARFVYIVALKKGYEGISINPNHISKNEEPNVFDIFTEEIIKFIKNEEV